MRLFKQREIYYIEFAGGKRKSLRTRIKRDAEKIFRELKKEEANKIICELDAESTVLLSEFIDIYNSHPDRKNHSKKTHEGDRLAINNLINVIGDKDINLVSRSDIDSFKQSLISRELSLFSINTYLRHLRAAFNFAIENSYRKEQISFKMFKAKDNKNHIIIPKHIDLLLEHTQETNNEMYRIIKFTLYTACRRSEIIDARYENVSEQMISVCGKGDKVRQIPLLTEATSVFENKRKGKIFKYKHVSTVSNNFRKIVRRLGIEARFHDLRHTSATQMLRKGIPLEVVQKILGHADIRTTQIYAKILNDTMKSEMGKLTY